MKTVILIVLALWYVQMTRGQYVPETRTLTIQGTSEEISVSSPNTQDLSADRTWTLSLPANISFGGKTSFEIPNGNSPSTSVFGQIAADNNAWGIRGAIQFYDGAQNTYLLGTRTSSTPQADQFPRFQISGGGGYIIWDDLAASDIPSTLNATSFGGKLQFSGTGHVGLDLHSLASEDGGITFDDGNMWYNSTTDEYRGYRDGTKRNFIMSGDGLGVNFQAGELIVGATANDSVRGIAKQDNGRMVSDNTGEVVWLTPAAGWRIDEDWINANIAGNNRWANFNSGGGGASIAIDDENVDGSHPGLVRLSVSSSNDYAGLHLGTNVVKFGGGPVVFEALILINALSTATDEYDVYVGFGDNTAGGDNTDGVYFLYDRDMNTNWLMATADNCPTNCTKDDSGIPVATGWEKLRIEIISGSSAKFYVDGELGGEVTADIPTGSSGPNIKIVRNSSVSTESIVDLDYVTVQQLFTTAR